MLTGALAGAGLGAAVALIFWGLAALRLDRLNQGLAGSIGLAGLTAGCLVLDGWLLTAIPAFVGAMIGLLRAQSFAR
ncbi:MAG: hypothetical protein ACQEUZ_08520 [Pseudomonadota bacterium]